MKVVMINDCAFVGQTLLKYLPHDVEKQHIQRTRGLWSKTLGLSWRILRAKGDVYHANYLLQDCYIASRLSKKPLLGHAHGSDLRRTLLSKRWGWIVRHNLQSCSKVIVSTVDVLAIARRFRDDAEYLPNPVDSELFYPKPVVSSAGKKKVLIASDCNWSVKGTDVAIRALSKVRDEVDVSIIGYGVDLQRTLALAESLSLRLSVLPKAAHERLAQYYWDSDLVIDRFKLGSLGMVSLEAIACGRPVLAYVSSEFPENQDFPLKDLKEEDNIAHAISNLSSEVWKDEYSFLKKHHDTSTIESRLLSFYNEMLRRQ